jgi:L-iditol 2-dehydrogenase
MGADHIISRNKVPDAIEAVRNLANGGRGPDRVIECVGKPSVWEQAIAMVRKAGTVSLFGGCPAETFAKVDTGRVHYDELTLIASFHHTPNSVREALRLIADGSFPAASFVQQHASLADLPDVLRSLLNGNCVVKVAIDTSRQG